MCMSYGFFFFAVSAFLKKKKNYKNNTNKTEQSPLTSTHCTIKKTMTYEIRNSGPGLGQAQKCNLISS